jgi:hypothetical protein
MVSVAPAKISPPRANIESAIVEDRLAFGGVKFDLQVITVATKYKAGQRTVIALPPRSRMPRVA